MLSEYVRPEPEERRVSGQYGHLVDGKQELSWFNACQVGRSILNPILEDPSCSLSAIWWRRVVAQRAWRRGIVSESSFKNAV